MVRDDTLGDTANDDSGDPAPVDQDQLDLVDRLWRSGTSATAVSPSTRDDLALLQRLLAADDRSVVVPLLRRHLMATWRLAAVVTMDAERSEAAVREAWREILDGDSEPISTRSNPRAWLFAVVRRHALRQGAAPGVELDLDATTTRVPFDETGDTGLLAASLSILDEAARTAIWLHAVEGFDDADVAHVIGLDRLETRELVDAAMADLRLGAVRGQLATSGDRCRPTVRDLAPYLDDDLDADAERTLLLHLQRCRRCAARLDALEAPGLSLVDRVMDPPKTLVTELHRLAAPVASN